MTKPILNLDFETRSTVDLRKTGVYKYAESQDTGLWCAAYSVDGAEPVIWNPTMATPDAIKDAVKEGWEIRAWNAQFERIIWRDVAVRYGWPVPKLEQFRCTAAEAAAMSLPRTLGECAKVLRLVEQKDDGGHKLMLQMCKPRRITEDGEIVWWADATKIKRQEAYCLQDVRTEMAVGKKLYRLPPEEMAVYHFDQMMNDRGVMLDMPLVHAMKHCVTKAKAALDDKMSKATGGRALKATQTKQITAFVQERNSKITSINKAALADILADRDTDDVVREVAEIREEAAKSSTAKLDAMIHVANKDARARGLFLYHGAGTGRWAGKFIQPQNLVRGNSDLYEKAIPYFLKHDIDYIDTMFAPIPKSVANLLRGCIIPKPNHVIMDADFANIEGRITAWFGQEPDALRAFVEYDAGTGADTYKTTYANTFGIPVSEVTSYQRQSGKILSLSSGFGGSVGAFAKMAGGDEEKLKKIADLVRSQVGDEEWEYAGQMYSEKSGLSEYTWTGIKAAVLKWRRANPNIVAFWYELMDAAVNAVRMPGTIFRVSQGRLRLRVKNGCLWLALPSGRTICYFQPTLKKTQMPWHTDDKPALKDTVFFWGMKDVGNGKKMWCEQPLTVPILTENAVQATARDLMVYAMFNVEKAGYPVIMTVHDELVSEVPNGFGSLKEYIEIMSRLPPWAEGLPLASAGWQGNRYRKDG